MKFFYIYFQYLFVFAYRMLSKVYSQIACFCLFFNQLHFIFLLCTSLMKRSETFSVCHVNNFNVKQLIKL